jgi:hypothetical protein
MFFLSLSLLKDVENLFDLSASAEGGRKKFDLPESKHLPPQPRIFEEIPCLQFESKDKTEFVNPSFRLDLLQERRMEDGDIFFSRLATGTKGQMPQCVHDLRNVDIVRASDAAGIAGSADPDRPGTKNPLAMAILDMSEDLVWKKIHRIRHRAAGGALLTLVARLKASTARPGNL